MIILYDSKTANFNNNGLGVLSDVISCEVMEERNGMFELELEHPFDLREKWKNLIEDNIIKAPTPTGEQLFRIYRKYKSMSGIRVFARHIFYDLIDNFLEDCRPENTDGTAALSRILSSTQYPNKFTSISDVPGPKTAYFIRKNPVEAIFSEDGVLGRWGGELERDNFLIKLLQNRGQDRGVAIRYGKNLLGIEEDLKLDSVITRIMPQGYDGLFLPEKYIDSPFINNYPHPKIRKIEYSDIKIDEENGITEAMVIAQLRERAKQEFSVNKIDIPVANYKVDFIELSKTEEYKDYAVLEKVYLCDTVTIKHLKLGFDLKAKVIKYKYNCLTNRYTEIELGAFKESMICALNTLTSLKDTVSNLLQNAVTGTKMQSAIDHATELLTGALGGHVVFRPKEKPTEILIMDTDDMLTAQKVWRWNLSGLGYSNKGVNGPYETAVTMDGYILGKFIAAHSITANELSSDAGQNLDLSSNNSIELKVSTAVDNVKIGTRNLIIEKNGFTSYTPYNSTPTVSNHVITTTRTGSNYFTLGNNLLKPSGICTVSGTMLINGNPVTNAMFLTKTANTYGATPLKFYVNDTTGRFEITQNFPGNDFIFHTQIGPVVSGSIITIKDLKLESGNKATDWSPAPEDTEDEIDRVNDLVTDITSDGVVTPLEKRDLKKEWDIIVAEKPTIEAQATVKVIDSADQSDATTVTLTIEKTAYTNAYSALSTELTPILADITVNSTNINSATLRTKFKDYYSTKEALLKAIIDKLNVNNNMVVSRFKQAEQKITDSSIISTVTSSTAWSNQNLQIVNAQELARAMSTGKILFADPMFKSGTNNCFFYNNSANGTVSLTRIVKPSDCPTTSTHCLEIKTTGTASPGWGGFYQAVQSRAGAKFVVKLIAKIPAGYVLNITSNGMGTGYSNKFITSNLGTGKYEEYIAVISCGVSGTFSTGGYFYLSGGNIPTATLPLIWQVAYCTAFDITDGDYSLVDVKNRVTTAETSIEQMAGQIALKVDANGVKSIIEQNPNSIKVGFNAITPNLNLSNSGIFEIINGALTVKNNNAEVVIDGRYNIHKIIATGIFEFSMPAGTTTRVLDFATHNLGYTPAFKSFLYQTEAQGHTVELPYQELTNQSSDFMGVKKYIFVGASATSLRVMCTRSVNSSNVTETIKIRYFIYKEVAF